MTYRTLISLCLLAVNPGLTSLYGQSSTLTPKVVFFGDDLTLGTQEGLDSAATFPQLVARSFLELDADISVANTGKAGDVSSEALLRMQNDVITRRPDAVVIMFGTQDAFIEGGKMEARVPLTTYREKIIQMVRYLKDISVTAILMTPPPMGNFFPEDAQNGAQREPYKSAGPNFLLNAYARACREIAEREQIQLVDHYQHWLDQAAAGQDLEAWLSQGIYLNEAGHQQVKELLFPTLKAAVMPAYYDVFVSGEEGYTSYRIPSAYLLSNGVLLAFAEGRNQASDHAGNDIVLKRSFDGGKSWLGLQVVAEDGENSLNNPQVLQIPESNRILLFYQRYPKGFHEKEVVPGYRGNICRAYQVYSDDSGKTWSEPEEITKDVKDSKATSIASGPGIGLVLEKDEKNKGRLIMPFNMGPFGQWQVYAVYSDNQGKSWKMGDPAPREGMEGYPNEVQLMELTDGRLMLNARIQGGMKRRMVAFSEDGGKSWSPLRVDSTLIDPGCMGSLYAYNSYYTLFSNPGTEDSRTRGTVRVSLDQGQTWPFAKVMYEGSFAYSCLTRLQDNYAGMLFERDDYSKITFVRFPVKWLFTK